MPIRHSIIHQIDKKPDGTPAVLHLSGTELAESQANENLLHDLSVAYNAKTGKAWGFFHTQSDAFPFSGWSQAYIEGGDFIEFSHTAVEHLQKLMEESNLSVGGHVLLAHYQQGLTDYLVVAMLQNSEGVTLILTSASRLPSIWTSAASAWPPGSISRSGAVTRIQGSTFHLSTQLIDQLKQEST